MNCIIKCRICKEEGVLFVTSREGFELYSLVAQVHGVPLGVAPLCPFKKRTATEQLARLAGEQALRLGFATLSAPSGALRPAAQEWANLSISAQKKKDSHPKGQLSFLAEKERFELSRR